MTSSDSLPHRSSYPYNVNILSLSLSLLILLAPSTSARSTAPSSLPQVDFSRMGTVGLGGSFSGLDFYSSSSNSGSNSAVVRIGDSLVRRGIDSAGTYLGTTDAGGSIHATCWSSWSSNSSSNSGTVFVAGNFTMIGGVQAGNAARYDVGGNVWSGINTGGTVRAVWCDDSNGRVWLGGEFDGGAKVFETGSGSVVLPPFQGLNGKVLTISPSTVSSSVLFGGEFTTSFTTNTTSNSTSNSSATSISSAPAGTVSTNTSAYLTPISLSNATISAGPSTIDPNLQQYADPRVLSCPAQGQGWVVQDGIEAKIDVLIGGNGGVEVHGVRVGNLVLDGRGTTTFCLVSIPDNTLRNMTYTDPITGKTDWCYSHCPLSTDPSVTAQDYLFDSPVTLTGFEVYLSEWQGASAALSRLQALSAGSFASAVQSQNAGVCAGNSTGSGIAQTTVKTTGDWTETQVFTDIPASVLNVLVSNVDTSSSDRPSVTYYPYVASSGYYDVNLLIPGCTQMQDCNERTSVDMTVFPFSGSLGYTSTISQQTNNDASVLVYSGFVQASATGSFQSTISLAMSSRPTAPGSGNTWEVVAGQMQLVFTAAAENGTTSTNGSTSATTTGTNSSAQHSFGVFEWPNSLTSLNAESTLANTSETSIDKIGFALTNALGSDATRQTTTSLLASGWSVEAFATLGSVAYVGGNFSQNGNWSNVLSVDTGNGIVAPLPNQGLNGVVHSAVAVGQYVFFGGEFTDTQSASSSSLSRIARYDTVAKSWSSLGGGVDGPVSQILSGAGNASLLVSGNFSNVLNSNSSSSTTGGFAIWNITSDSSGGSWDTTSLGIVFGSVTQAMVTPSDSYLAGRIAGLSSNGGQGIAMLSGSGSNVVIDTLPISLSSSENATTSAASTAKVARRSIGVPVKKTTFSLISRSLVNIVTEVVTGKRQATTAVISAPAIPRATSEAPAILTGTFWTNSSASGKPSITVLGGNFSKTSPAIAGLTFYDQSSKVMTGTQGQQLNGVVRALAVVDNTLFVGGSLSVGSGQGLAMYSLANNQWMTNVLPSLSPASGNNVTVNAIGQRDNTDDLIVAGTFATAGSLACAAICQWAISENRWSALGSGLQSGEVRAIDFAGSSSDILVIAGSFVMSDSTVAYVAQYSFANSTWVSLGKAGTGAGQIPGPATAMTVDNNNSSNIFISGLSSADQSTYILQWDGSTWNQQNNTLSTGSVVQQLVFVPLSSSHSGAGAIEGDRMLMVSGDLDLGSTGTFSSALFDGQQWHPYLTSLSATGDTGSVSSLFYSQHNFSFTAKHFLAAGIVVLIAIAISTGLIFLLVLIGVLLALWRRPSQKHQDAAAATAKVDPGAPMNESDTDSAHQRRLGAIQQAIFGPVLVGAAAEDVTREKRRSDASSFEDYTAGAIPQSRGDHSDDSAAPSHLGRPSQAKYDFVGEQEGELTVRMHDKLWVLEEHEDEQWSYVRDAHGSEGVVPASYIW